MDACIRVGLGRMVAKIAQVLVKVVGRTVSARRLLGETAVDDPAQRGGHALVEGRRIFANDGGHGLDRAALHERMPSRGELVEDEPKGKLVGVEIDLLAKRLLGTHIAGGAHDRADMGQARGAAARRYEAHGGFAAGDGIDDAAVGFLPMRQSKIDDFDAAFGGEHDVFGLQVSMDEAGGVCGGQAVGYLCSEIGEFSDRDALAGE